MSRDLVKDFIVQKQLCLQPLQICKIRCRNNSARSRDKDFINLHRVSFLRFADTQTKLPSPYISKGEFIALNRWRSSFIMMREKVSQGVNWTLVGKS